MRSGVCVFTYILVLLGIYLLDSSIFVLWVCVFTSVLVLLGVCLLYSGIFLLWVCGGFLVLGSETVKWVVNGRKLSWLLV